MRTSTCLIRSISANLVYNKEKSALSPWILARYVRGGFPLEISNKSITSQTANRICMTYIHTLYFRLDGLRTKAQMAMATALRPRLIG